MRRRGQEIGRGVRDSKSYFQICDPTVSCVIMAFWDHIEIHRTTQCSQLSIKETFRKIWKNRLLNNKEAYENVL